MEPWCGDGRRRRRRRGDPRAKVWQYTNGGHGVPGVGSGPADLVHYPRNGHDQSCIRGTAADLRAWWTGAVP